jgi:hypothetical protein
MRHRATRRRPAPDRGRLPRGFALGSSTAAPVEAGNVNNHPWAWEHARRRPLSDELADAQPDDGDDRAGAPAADGRRSPTRRDLTAAAKIG